MRILLMGIVLAALPADAIAKGGHSSGFHFGSSRTPSYRATGDHYVSGYTRSNGTYVTGHYQTNANATRNDNYSTRGNINPHTGQPGTKPRDEDPK